MKLGTFIRNWLSEAPTKAEAIRRYRAIAFAQAMISLAMVGLWATAPGWIPEAYLPKFSALFLTGAAVFASMAAATLGSTWLIRRDLY
ncbi:hypothetical protein QU487_06505 [Crenobacter sp. SG2305]|uniref:hypothetical protein n=1 Tax=Crenobacter oryzisoli TaxID=3056844 RepID=UPI0025AAA7B1|nr:hypothetical protein [Crenobacter sp. SG2305]MDN0082404.1 hypothetical protein [Crenobacter sp. SG2305]